MSDDRPYATAAHISTGTKSNNTTYVGFVTDPETLGEEAAISHVEKASNEGGFVTQIGSANYNGQEANQSDMVGRLELDPGLELSAIDSDLSIVDSDDDDNDSKHSLGQVSDGYYLYPNDLSDRLRQHEVAIDGNCWSVKHDKQAKTKTLVMSPLPFANVPTPKTMAEFQNYSTVDIQTFAGALLATKGNHQFVSVDPRATSEEQEFYVFSDIINSCAWSGTTPA